MIVAIAVYFCIADGVLIGQCLYYKARNSRQPRPRRRTSSSVFEPSTPDPTTPLLGRRFSDAYAQTGETLDNPRNSTRRAESSSDDMLAKIVEENDVGRKAWVKNFSSVLGICVIGMAGWTVAWRTGVWKPAPVEEGLGGVDMAPGAMVLGYISAICYLGYVCVLCSIGEADGAGANWNIGRDFHRSIRTTAISRVRVCISLSDRGDVVGANI